MNTESIYWLFSSAAQSIAGLIGFLMAGVALAFSMMDRLADEDDTLREVIHALKTRYHRDMSALSLATGLAITTSLLVLYVNPSSAWLRLSTLTLAAILDFSVICGAIFFVISVASPARYTRAAQGEYQQTIKEISGGKKREPDHVFFREFVELEREIRDYLTKHDLCFPNQGVTRISFSFRQMIQALYQSERISPRLRDKFLAVSKARNLLFHGHIEEVDEKVIDDLRETRRLWNDEKTTEPNQQPEPTR
jgi:hypothetical protein